MEKVLPHLSTDSWVTDPTRQLDILLGHFFATESLQSNEYPGAIVSWKDLLARFGNRPDEMAGQLENALDSYIGRYFTDRDVEVSPDVKDGVEYDLNLAVSVVKDGKTISLRTILKQENGIFKKFADKE